MNDVTNETSQYDISQYRPLYYIGACDTYLLQLLVCVNEFSELCIFSYIQIDLVALKGY